MKKLLAEITMKKTHKIIAIPITDRNIKVGDVVRYNKSPFDFEIVGMNLLIDNWTPQQLIVFDEKIFVPIKGNELMFTQLGIKKAKYDGYSYNSDIYNSFAYKIIATYPELELLPKLNINFIKQWCEQPSEFVEVEYEEMVNIRFYANKTGEEYLELKLNSDNTIIASIYEEKNCKNCNLKKYPHKCFKADIKLNNGDVTLFNCWQPIQKVDKLLTDRSKNIELLEKYSLFLEKQGYLDTDWRTEPPFAIDKFLQWESKNKK